MKQNKTKERPVIKALTELTSILVDRKIITPLITSTGVNVKTGEKFKVKEKIELTPIHTPRQFKEWVDILTNVHDQFMIAFQTEHDSYIIRHSDTGRLIELIDIKPDGQHQSLYVFDSNDDKDKALVSIGKQLLEVSLRNREHFSNLELTFEAGV